MTGDWYSPFTIHQSRIQDFEAPQFQQDVN